MKESRIIFEVTCTTLVDPDIFFQELTAFLNKRSSTLMFHYDILESTEVDYPQ